jgi:hypothetical protein
MRPMNGDLVEHQHAPDAYHNLTVVRFTTEASTKGTNVTISDDLYFRRHHDLSQKLAACPGASHCPNNNNLGMYCKGHETQRHDLGYGIVSSLSRICAINRGSQLDSVRTKATVPTCKFDRALEANLLKLLARDTTPPPHLCNPVTASCLPRRARYCAAVSPAVLAEAFSSKHKRRERLFPTIGDLIIIIAETFLSKQSADAGVCLLSTTSRR